MEIVTEQQRLKALIDKYKAESKYIASLNIQVGNTDHQKLVNEMKKIGTDVLFFTGSRAMNQYGFIRKYLDLFSAAGMEVYHFNNIEPNPTLKQMEDGVKHAMEFTPSLIFALGGGSVIDTAKIVSVGMFGDIWDYVEKKAAITAAIPIVASATTSGTGSHVTPYAVVTNTDTLEKKTLKHDFLLPKISASDVDITRYMKPKVIASTGFDVLCHAAEVYTRKDCTQMAADFCELSLKCIRQHLISSYYESLESKPTIENKLGMMYADIYAGIALSLIGTHVPHAISHPISAHFHEISHGEALAYVFAETSKRQIDNGDSELKEKFRHISDLLGGSKDFVRTIKNYQKLLGLEMKPGKFIPDDRLIIAKETLGYRKSSVDKSPAGLSDSEITEIIDKTLI